MAEPFEHSADRPPPGVRVDRRDGALRIERRWVSRSAVMLAAVAAGWNGFVIYLYAFAEAPPGTGAQPGPFVLLPPLLMAIGLGLVYAALARCLNATAIEVLGGEDSAGGGTPGRTVRVRHGPMPWPGRVEIDAGRIERLYLEAHRSESSRVRGRWGSRQLYSINARMRGGEVVRLAASVERPEQAGFILRRLERELGLGGGGRRGGG